MVLRARLVSASLALGALLTVASCLLTSNFDGLTGNDATSAAASGGGGHAGPTTGRGSGPATGAGTGGGGFSAVSAGGAGGAGGLTATSSSSPAASSGSAGAGGSGGAGGAGGAGCGMFGVAGAFPSQCVLDDFERSDAPLGLPWLLEHAGAYNVVSRHVAASVPDPATVIWTSSFGPNQEAYITVKSFDPADGEIELVLKGQGAAQECGSLLVDYIGGELHTYYCDVGFVNLGASTTPVTLQPGDQLGARALADGKVQAYVNGVLVGTWDASAYSHATLGGYIGFYSSGIFDEIDFDDFGGGGD